jgi:hypothetical protein
MKRLRPNFQRSLGMAVATALGGIGISILLAPSALRAGSLQSPPPWIPYEREAISLYLLGMSQETSDPQAAVKTLSKARQESFAAIANGGGANQAVQHNDALIGQALMLAQADAAKAPQNNNQPAATEIQGQNQNHSQSQKSSGNKTARPSSIHNSQVTLRGR